MKRLASIAQDNDADWGILRDRGNHEIWAMNGERIIIPRHAEIQEGTAATILKAARNAAGEDKDE